LFGCCLIERSAIIRIKTGFVNKNRFLCDGFPLYRSARFFETDSFLPVSKIGQPPAGFKQVFCN